MKQIERKVISLEKEIVKIKEKAKKKEAKLNAKIHKVKPIPQFKLARQVWRKLSRYVRTNEDHCFTCNKPLPWEERIAGHGFDKASYTAVKLDLINVHTQCKRCNRHKHGDGMNYALTLVGLHGLDAVLKLQERALNKIKPTKEDLEELDRHYTHMLSLEKLRNDLK